MAVDALITDDSAWPILIHTTIGIPSMGEVDSFIKRADSFLARKEKHVVIFDNRQAGRVPSYMRQRSFEWVKANRAELDQHCAGIALVISSPALRFLMTTVMLVTSHTVPSEVFKDRETAVAWARTRMASTQVRSRA